ncbi:MAG: hypothetical protein QXX08_05865 [Candidatus Bathyarchaeia archaeon]
MIENEEKTFREWLKIILPRVLRAVLYGVIMVVILLFPVESLITGGMFQELLTPESTTISYFLYVFIGFEVAIQLLKGTIIQYALGVARGLATMIFLVFVTNGGIISFSSSSSSQIPTPQGIAFSFTIDFRVIVAVFLIFSLLSIIKNLFQTIDFLSDKAEEPMVPPELP